MDAQPPRDDIAVRHHQSRRRHRQRPKTQLIQMQKIGTRVANDGAQIILGRVEILLPFLHPVETKRGGMVFKPMQPIHPSGLMGKRNFSKADERTVWKTASRSPNPKRRYPTVPATSTSARAPSPILTPRKGLRTRSTT